MTQIKCPECGSFKTQSVSVRTVLLKVGCGCLLFGAATAIFIIGIPFLVLGVPITLVGLLWKRGDQMQCKTCRFLFTR